MQRRPSSCSLASSVSALALERPPSSGALRRQSSSGSLLRQSSSGTLSRRGSQRKRETLKARFKELDVNGDGLLDMDEFTTLLTSGGSIMPESKFRLLFSSIDANNDGVVSFDEFVDFIYSTPEHPPELTGPLPPLRGRVATAPPVESDGPRAVTPQDVNLLMASLTDEQRKQVDQPWAVAEGRRRFLALARTEIGFVTKAKLRAELTSVFPGVDEELFICRGCLILPLSSSLPAVMSVFDLDGDGKLSQDEFLPLARFCQAWCIHKNFNSDAGSFSLAVTKRNSRRRLVTMNLQDLSSTAPAVLWADHKAPSLAPSSPRSESCSEPESAHPRERSKSAGQEMRSSARLLDEWHLEEDAQGASIFPGSPSATAARHRVRRSAALLEQTLKPRTRSQPSPQEAERRRKREKEKFNALAAVVESERDRSLDDLAYWLFHPVANDEGQPKFSREQIQAVVDRVVPPTFSGAEVEDPDFDAMSPAIRPNRRANTAEAVPKAKPASRRRASAIMCAPMAEIAKIPSRGRTADALTVQAGKGAPSKRSALTAAVKKPATKKRIEIVIEILNMLADSFLMRPQALLSQVLWRHRMCQCLQTPKFNRALDDVSWVVAPDVYEDVAFIFEVFSRKTGGTMNHDQFQKSIQLVQKNAVLKSHIRLTDSDRVWKHLMNKEGVQTIGFNAYVRLILDLAETCCASPWMIFNALACHVGTLSEQDVAY